MAAQQWLNKSAAQGFTRAIFTLDVFYPDKFNGPRVPPEIIPRVEAFVEDLAKMVGSGSPE